MTEERRQQYVKAFEETALAYFRKRDRIQYESSDMTYLHMTLGGPFRRTDKFSPEAATKDSYLFSVCSSFMHAILWDTCRYSLCNSEVKHTCLSILEQYRDQIVYSYSRDSQVRETDGMRQCLETMQPGDFFIIRHRIRQNHYHVMMRISGNRIIHCAGGKYNFKTGEETWEHQGAIRVDDIDEYLVNVLGGFPFHSFQEWKVLRIVDAIDPEKYPLTPAALTRVQYPGLNYDRFASLRAYQTVCPGDTITYTIRLRNETARKAKSCHANLVVEETIPQGTTLVESSLDAEVEVEGNKLRWVRTVNSVQEHTMQYTVRVNADVKPGTQIVSEGCRMENIPGCTIKTTVAAGKLTEEQREKLARVKKKDVVGDAANWVCKNVLGLEREIPSVEAYLDSLYERTDVECVDDEDRERYKDNVLLKRKETADVTAERMFVPGLHGGMSLGCVSQYERVLELRSENLQPGDVVLAAKELRKTSLAAEQMVILGHGKMLHTTKEGLCLTNMPAMDVLHSYDYFAVLRPCMM